MMQYDKYFSAFQEVPAGYKDRLWEEALPFYYKYNENCISDSLIISLHGFRATPYESRPIREAVINLGLDIDVAAPLLPGHGYSDIADQKKAILEMDSSVEAVRQEISRAREMGYEKIFLHGQSMGGAIALIIASENIIDACATTAPAIKLPVIARVADILFGWANLFLKYDPEDDPNIFYRFDTSRGTRILLEFARTAKEGLPRIRIPLLVVHSTNDDMVDPVVGEWIESKSGSRVKRVWFNDSGHSMTLDVNGKEVSEEVAGFFQSQRQQIH
jgi:carboxylesterase